MCRVKPGRIMFELDGVPRDLQNKPLHLHQPNSLSIPDLSHGSAAIDTRRLLCQINSY